MVTPLPAHLLRSPSPATPLERQRNQGQERVGAYSGSHRLSLDFLMAPHSYCLTGGAGASHEGAHMTREARPQKGPQSLPHAAPGLSVHRDKVWPSHWHPWVSGTNSSELNQAGTWVLPSADLPWEGRGAAKEPSASRGHLRPRMALPSPVSSDCYKTETLRAWKVWLRAPRGQEQGLGLQTLCYCQS